MDIRIKRTALIEALEARRPWAQKRDAKAKKKHEADEARAFALFRKRCEAALKLDYEGARQQRFTVTLEYKERGSPCPSSVEKELDAALAQVKLGTSPSVHIRERVGGRYGSANRLHWLLTHDDAANKDMCEV